MTKKKIDLRSDTVTLPTPQMREAMFSSELGDDVYGEDPTVNRLEELAARMTGKESALFVASGTMGNLVSVLAHCQRGDEMILGNMSHIHIHEQGAAAALGGVHSRVVSNRSDGTMDLGEIEELISDGKDFHCARTVLICLENTWYGRVLDPVYMQEVAELARQHNLYVHLDGARLFNAAVALNIPAAALCQDLDSVQFCLSKGLAAPVGSMVCGNSEFIGRARRVRKQLGGAMRQSGVLAAAGIVALKTMLERLEIDHLNAKFLADNLAKIQGIKVLHAETNMVFVGSEIPGISTGQLCQELNRRGLLSFEDKMGIRMVTHYGIGESDIEIALEIATEAVECLSEKKVQRI